MSDIEKLIELKGGVEEAAKAVGVTGRSLFTYRKAPASMPDSIKNLIQLLIQEEKIARILAERN